MERATLAVKGEGLNQEEFVILTNESSDAATIKEAKRIASELGATLAQHGGANFSYRVVRTGVAGAGLPAAPSVKNLKIPIGWRGDGKPAANNIPNKPKSPRYPHPKS